MGCSQVLTMLKFAIFIKIFLESLPLALMKPAKMMTCPDLPNQEDALLGTEQSFKANLTSDVYYCRKIFDGSEQAFEIVRQEIAQSSDKPDSIEVTDCKSYYYIITIDHSCNFELVTPNCVKYCYKNNVCPTESKLCTKKAPYRRFYPEMDLNHQNDALYNFNNTLKSHCDISVMNELPMDQPQCT